LDIACDQLPVIGATSPIYPDEDAAKLIRKDRIDILIDLSMHMANNRLLLFARKPAPIQATYLAYCSTTGLEAIDYRITDPYLDPPGQDDSITPSDRSDFPKPIGVINQRRKFQKRIHRPS